MHHELTRLLAAQGLKPCTDLVEMMDDHFSHCSERRGCGLTQATRFLSRRINRHRHPMDARDLDIFDAWPQRETSELAQAAYAAGWGQGWRNLHKAPPDVTKAIADHALATPLLQLADRIMQVRQQLCFEESRLLIDLIHDMLLGTGDRDVTAVRGLPSKPEVGSCSQAELFFLEIAHRRVRRGGQVNTIINEHGRAVLLEKINLGESHSAISLVPLCVFNVRLPPGSLFELQYATDTSQIAQPTASGQLLPLAAVSARFMRLSTLAISPKHRARAFTHQLQAQLRHNMLSPLTTTLAALEAFAQEEQTCSTT